MTASRERVAWLALAVLHAVERGEGFIEKKGAMKVLREKLKYSDRQARNILNYLLEQQYLIPIPRGLRVTGFRVSGKGLQVLENLGLI
ncbi:hypothetical protein [Thermofilum sp.]|uniref:hypothetical protein n=1 Tax=Thermofilum sp. TaxID=1961369 RepID=UPI003167261A